jgi:hypothetical protein
MQKILYHHLMEDAKNVLILFEATKNSTKTTNFLFLSRKEATK